jgi:tetratricopeptide (TPR) repeat protein
MNRGSARAWVVLALVVGVACVDDATRLENHRARGEAYFEAEEYPEAVIEFKNVLQIDPNDVVAHFGLARAYLAQGGGRARWELGETVRLDPTHDEARLLLANLLFYAGVHERSQGNFSNETFEEVLGHADAVLSRDPDHTDALLTRGRVLAALERPEDARTTLDQVLEKEPDRPEALLMLANLHRSRGDREAAEPLLRRWAEKKGGFVAFRALAGFLAAEPERDDETEAFHRKAMEAAEGKQLTIGVQALAGFYASRDRFEEAEAVIHEGIERSEGDLDLVLVLARFYDGRGELERADEVIEEATRARPDEVAPLLILSAYRGYRGDREGALEAADAALEIDPQHKNARLRKAELLVDLGFRGDRSTRIAAGRSIVDAILATEEGDPQALFVRAKIQMAEGLHEEAIATLRQTLDARPDWAQGHFLLGSALYASGDRIAAREQLVRALEIDASLMAARRILLEVRTALAEYDLVIEDGRRILAARPDERRVRVLVAQALVRRRDLAEALALLEQVPTTDRDEQVHYALARIYRMQGDLELARAHLEQAHELNALQPDVLATLLAIDSGQGRLPESLVRLRAAVDADPGSSTLLQLRGVAEARSGLSSEAESSFRAAIDLDPNNLSAYQRLAEFLASTGRRGDVVRTYEKALAARPESSSLNLIVGILHEGMGRQDSALARYEAAIRLDPELAAAKNNLAYLLAERGQDLDRALDLAQEAKALLPDNANAADTLGWVLYKKNIPSAAIGYLKEAEGGFPPEDPSLGIVRQHLALAYEANGEADQARGTVDRALSELAEQVTAFEARTGRTPIEPAWAAELRNLRDRLDSAGLERSPKPSS